jgi:DNA-binding transcriptional MocR family regulator
MSDVRDTRQGGWGWYQYQLLDHFGPQLGPTAIAVYVALTRFANNATQTTRPAAERIATTIGVSVRQVRREFAKLGAAGLIQSTPRYDADGRQLPNEYILVDLRDLVARGDTPSPLGVTVRQGEGDCVSPKQDSVDQDSLEQERGRAPAPSPPLEQFEPTDTETAWFVAEARAAGVPESAIDVPRETATWRDMIATGARPRPRAPAADWRIWMRRAIRYAQQHPELGGSQHRTLEHRARRTAADDAAADAAAQQLIADLDALAGPGRGSP